MVQLGIAASGAEIAGPAVTLNKYGEGQAIYIGAPIFWAMKDRPYWIRQWLPPLLRQLVPNPAMELRLEPFSEYVHGTFFHDRSGQFVLVQILNTIEIITRGELREAPKISLAVNSSKLRVTEARVVWPKTLDLPVTTRGGKTHIALPRLDRYMALFLKLA